MRTHPFILMLISTLATASVAETTITYQGQLQDGAGVVTATPDMEFRLYDSLTGDTQVGPTLERDEVPVTDGLFQVELDFGNVYDQELWLEVTVDGTALDPLQRIAPAPMALHALNAPDDTLAGLNCDDSEGVSWNGTDWVCTELGEGSGSAWELDGGNVFYTSGFVGIGTASPSTALQVTGSVILGAPDNTVTGDNSFVSGGGGSWSNHVPGSYAFVAGGRQNEASGDQSVVAGGFTNLAEGPFSAVVSGDSNESLGNAAFVGGGAFNVADASDAAIVGGRSNLVDGNAGFVGGGRDNVASGSNAFVAGGSDNLAEGSYSFAAGRHAHSLHSGAFVWSDSSAFASDFTSTADDQFRVRAGGGVSYVVGDGGWRMEPGSPPNLIGGYGGNHVDVGTDGATIAGGGQDEYTNQIVGHFGTIGGGLGNTSTGNATVGGGRENQATGQFSTIAGGADNIASSGSTTVGGGNNNSAVSSTATVGGGFGNTAGNNSVVAGGSNNEALNGFATVAGGGGNVASGRGSAIPGGEDNVAAGEYSFAAGHKAIASEDGSFVWADNLDQETPPVGENGFLARATGGVAFVTGVNASGDPTAGAVLPDGGSSWQSISDRHAKTAVTRVEPGKVLERLARMPISEYSYKSQEKSIRHMGPMAQDFQPLFGLGEDELRISAMNLAGVALAAIQGLHGELEDLGVQLEKQEQRIVRLESENAELRQIAERNAELEDRLARLEALLHENRQVAGGQQ